MTILSAETRENKIRLKSLFDYISILLLLHFIIGLYINEAVIIYANA